MKGILRCLVFPIKTGSRLTLEHHFGFKYEESLKGMVNLFGTKLKKSANL